MTNERLYPTRPFLAASVAVFRNGKALLASRGKPPWEDASRCLVAASKPGETLGAGCARELEEEVGVSATLTGLVAPFEVIERDVDGRVKHHMVIAVYAARWPPESPVPGRRQRKFVGSRSRISKACGQPPVWRGS